MSKQRVDNKIRFWKALMLVSLFTIPFFVALEFIVLNNPEKINLKFKNFVVTALIFLTIVFIVCFSILIVKKSIFKKPMKKIGITFIFMALSFWLTTVVRLFYYNEDFKEWLITSSFSSINYKHIATSIYSDSTINDVIGSEVVALSGDIIDFSDITYNNKLYANKYEEEILDREEGAIYKIIKVSGTTIGANYHYEGYLVAVYDPSNVRLAKSTGAGVDSEAYGETLSTISRKHDAIIAMNAGGFYDPNWNSNGGIPHGDVIINGKLDTSYIRGLDSGGLVGFDSNNKLVLKRMDAETAISYGIRDAVDWGPYLIVNGNNYYKNVKHYTWACGRTAIGQRADGIVLMLVIDGLQSHSKGAAYADMAAIMEKYGAINAANMDGGTSTSMTLNHEYINSPWNGYVKTYRWLPNAWIVKK